MPQLPSEALGFVESLDGALKARLPFKASGEAKSPVANSGEILLYGIIGDWFDGLDAKSIVEKIAALGEVDALTVRINSPGGLVTDGLAIYNYLAQHKAEVTVIVDGLAASMGSVVAMAGKRIVMPESAVMMIHNPWNIVAGDAETLRKEADTLDTLAGSLRSIYRDRTGLSEKKLGEMMDAETWMNGAEALDLGFATENAGEAQAMASADLSKFNFKNVPAHLATAIETAGAMAAIGPTTAEVPPPNERKDVMTDTVTAGQQTAEIQAEVARQVAAIRERDAAIRAQVAKAKLSTEFADTLIAEEGMTAEKASARIIDEWAKQTPEQKGPNVVVTADEKDKWQAGATAWIITKAGPHVAAMVEKHSGMKLDAGEFRGMKLLDLARDSLERGGIRARGMDQMKLVGTAFTARGAVTQSTSDFAVLLENAMHKVLISAYALMPVTWPRFCATSSVSDFRANNRYVRGTFGTLDTVNENGEFKFKSIPDGVKESITATTKGNRINLSRQAIINDDMSAFDSLASELGEAARFSVEQDVYDLLALNSGLGPDMSDGNPLFDASHNNVGTGAALSVDGLDADRVTLMSQTDPSGNRKLDLRPDVLLVPASLGGNARVINVAQYDPDTSNKLQKPNKAAGMFSDIVDTALLSGTRRYIFSRRRVIEVAFLDGQQDPFLDMMNGWSVDGVEWKVRLDYGVAATQRVGAVTNAGA